MRRRSAVSCRRWSSDFWIRLSTACDQPGWDIEGDFLWFGPEDGGFGHYLIFYFDGGDTVTRVQLTDYFD